MEVFQELLILKVQLVPASGQKCVLLLWPILVTFDPSSFYFLCHHGDDVRFVFPDHLPKGLNCGGQRALAGDVEELICSDLYADVAGIDVLLVLSDGYSCFIICRSRNNTVVDSSNINMN